MVKHVYSLVCMMILLASLCAAQSPATVAKTENQTAAAAISAADRLDDSNFQPLEEFRMFQWVNEEREKQGAPRLKLDRLLSQSARKHAVRVADSGELLHRFIGEDALMLRIAATGMRFSSAAENLAQAMTQEEMHEGLMQSPGHRKNILQPDYDSIGIGVILQNGHFVAVQNFARSVPEMTNFEAEQWFAEAVHTMRAEHKLPRVLVVNGIALRQSVCTMAKKDKMEVKELPSDPGALGVLGFTSFELKEWPKNLRELVQRPELRRITVGACFQVTPSYPGGTYWFGLVF